ncbi:MAG: lipid-A-disaccharide synthase-related protein [Pseudomonadota bacterium]
MNRFDMHRFENKPILFVSNGHGEDDIACKVLSELMDILPHDTHIEAWPMVGSGDAYRSMGIPIVGPSNLLPSEGFATLSWDLMKRDLRSGWISTHWKQYRFAEKRISGRYNLVVGVGDIIPLLVGYFSRVPLHFIACAKSAYYKDTFDGYTWLERMLMRKVCKAIYPRDRLTTERLRMSNVKTTYLGNPMMDGLEYERDLERTNKNTKWISVLPGSRQDVLANILHLMQVIEELMQDRKLSDLMGFKFAIYDMLPVSDIHKMISNTNALAYLKRVEPMHKAEPENTLEYEYPNGARLVFAKRQLPEILHTSTLTIGMAGTANEQSIGLGNPLIVIPSEGAQGKNYVAMKMKYFGEAAELAPRDPKQAAKVILDVLTNPKRGVEMAKAGRERMGSPGASLRIANSIAQELGIK